jgi:excisionase family DNA binding protein
MNKTDKLLVPLNEARELLGNISRTNIYALAAKGDLKIVKVGRRTLFRVSDLKAFAETLG